LIPSAQPNAQLGCQSGALTTMAKTIRVNGARFMFWVSASLAPSWPTRCFSSASLRSTHQADVASMYHRRDLSGQDDVELSISHRWRLPYLVHAIRIGQAGSAKRRSGRHALEQTCQPLTDQLFREAAVGRTEGAVPRTAPALAEVPFACFRRRHRRKIVIFNPMKRED